MKSYLIKDTTKSERIALIKEWIVDDDGLEACGIDLWDMYNDYINGIREISEINASFQTEYYTDKQKIIEKLVFHPVLTMSVSTTVF